MVPTRFGGQPLDHCVEDRGLWFDPGELVRTLENVGHGYLNRQFLRGNRGTTGHGRWVPRAETDRITLRDIARWILRRPKRLDP
jgi:hypothetical protein